MTTDGTISRIEAAVHSLADRLQAAGLMCATAESCTGGWIAQTLTSVAGSSNWFDCGFVTYSNASKTRLLGVDAGVIEEFGAVSVEVARAMADGAVANSNAGVSVAVTGIAGPDGGTARNPVGTVVFAWRTPDMTTPEVETVRFPGGRRDVRWATVLHAVTGLTRRVPPVAPPSDE